MLITTVTAQLYTTTTQHRIIYNIYGMTSNTTKLTSPIIMPNLWVPFVGVDLCSYSVISSVNEQLV